MGFLGIMAAGAARGARDASNANVNAQNEMELENNRERLRQQFYDRAYSRQRADSIADSKAASINEDRVYQRNRNDKVADNASQQEFKKALLTQTQDHQRGMHNERMALGREKLNLAKSSAASGGSSPSGMMDKLQSPAGKAASDLMRMGLASDPATAYEMAIKLDIVKAAKQNPLTKISDDELLNSVNRLTRGLYPNGGRGSQQDQSSESMVRTFNPKTGRIE